MAAEQKHRYIRPIGEVHSPFADKFGIPRQPGLAPGLEAQLVFFPPFRNCHAVKGLEEFSHLWLLFDFHLIPDQFTNRDGDPEVANWCDFRPTVRPPRLGGNASIGVFATRSPFRPNRIGLSLVRLDRIDFTSELSPVLHLSGVDLVDRTPIWDIKPYLPYAEALPDAKAGFASAKPNTVNVTVDPQFATKWQNLKTTEPKLAQVIIQVLSLDPRPAIHQQKPSERIYHMLIGDREVSFYFESETCFIKRISDIERGQPTNKLDPQIDEHQ